MDKKFEEKLLAAAFGDLTPEESEHLESRIGLDPEAEKALQEMRQIKQGLRELADVPPHQLSTERLRHAILHEGLKPRTQRWSFGWLAAPAAAAAALVAAYVAVSRQDSPVGDIRALTASKAGPKNGFVVEERAGVVFNEPFGPVAPRAWSPDEAAKPIERTRLPRKKAGSIRARAAGISISGESYGPTREAPPNNGGTPSARLSQEDSQAASGIVVIESERGDTGANVATEVGSARNVVIGG